MDKIALIRLVAMYNLVALISERWGDQRLTATAINWVSGYRRKLDDALCPELDYCKEYGITPNLMGLATAAQWTTRNMFDKLVVLRDQGGHIIDLFSSMPEQ